MHELDSQNFESLSPTYVCNIGVVDNEHFSQYYNLFKELKSDLFVKLSEIPGLAPNDITPRTIMRITSLW